MTAGGRCAANHDNVQPLPVGEPYGLSLSLYQPCSRVRSFRIEAAKLMWENGGGDGVYPLFVKTSIQQLRLFPTKRLALRGTLVCHIPWGFC